MAKARAVPFVDPEASLFVHAAVAIGTRLDELVAFETYLADASEVYQLHQMRIAAKRLRYTMDLFQVAFSEYSRYGREFASAITEVKLLQEHLGDIHDADVLAPRLTGQLYKLMGPAQGNDKHGQPRVGVHLVDFDACAGLLALCMEAKRARETSFERLRTDWARMREQNLFDQWRKLLRNAITDETLASVLHDTAVLNVKSESAIAPASDETTNTTRLDAGLSREAANEIPRESRNGKSTRTRTRTRASGSDA